MDKLTELLSGARGKKLILLVLGLAALLLLIPSGPGEQKEDEKTEEARLGSFLAQVEGVGRVTVLLSEGGAVVVCEGAADASVQLRITEAVRCYTGLGADRVEIFQMKQ